MHLCPSHAPRHPEIEGKHIQAANSTKNQPVNDFLSSCARFFPTAFSHYLSSISCCLALSLSVALFFKIALTFSFGGVRRGDNAQKFNAFFMRMARGIVVHANYTARILRTFNSILAHMHTHTHLPNILKLHCIGKW